MQSGEESSNVFATSSEAHDLDEGLNGINNYFDFQNKRPKVIDADSVSNQETNSAEARVETDMQNGIGKTSQKSSSECGVDNDKVEPSSSNKVKDNIQPSNSPPAKLNLSNIDYNMLEQEINSLPGVNSEDPIIIYHNKIGLRTFQQTWEAVLFLLSANGESICSLILDLNRARKTLRKNITGVANSDLWKFKLLKMDDLAMLATSTRNVLDEMNYKSEGSPSTNVNPVVEQTVTQNQNNNQNHSTEQVDLSLPQTMHIPLDQKGELISFSMVRKWVNPTVTQMNALRQKIMTQWMEPFLLKQQDLVRATGVGAPYLCYLFRDPNNPNMTHRRRIEAYSVLSELMRRYEDGEITSTDLIVLRNSRVQYRYLRRKGLQPGNKQAERQSVEELQESGQD